MSLSWTKFLELFRQHATALALVGHLFSYHSKSAFGTQLLYDRLESVPRPIYGHFGQDLFSSEVIWGYHYSATDEHSMLSDLVAVCFDVVGYDWQHGIESSHWPGQLCADLAVAASTGLLNFRRS
jgi:hypothetical protein